MIDIFSGRIKSRDRDIVGLGWFYCAKNFAIEREIIIFDFFANFFWGRSRIVNIKITFVSFFGEVVKVLENGAMPPTTRIKIDSKPSNGLHSFYYNMS